MATDRMTPAPRQCTSANMGFGGGRPSGRQASRENTRVRIYEVLEYRSVIARRVTYTSRLVAEPSEQR